MHLISWFQDLTRVDRACLACSVSDGRSWRCSTPTAWLWRFSDPCVSHPPVTSGPAHGAAKNSRAHA